MSAPKKLHAVVAGLGYWGPNLARNLSVSTDFELVGLVDVDAARLARVGDHHPSARRFQDLRPALAALQPDLVCIATPAASHVELARLALEGGSHVLVEKPMARTHVEARELLALASAQKRQIFVDHTFLFTGAVREIKKQVEAGALGALHYVDSVRINLGLFQPDADVLWDLAPHDLAILQFILGRTPRTVRAMGSSHNPSGFADVAYLHLDYGDGLTAHLHLSWLSPVKVRRMIFAGHKQSVIYDDLEPAEKVKIYDHGVSFDVPADLEARAKMLVSYRKGDMRAPNVSLAEAIGVQLADIAAALRGERAATAPGRAGADVVRVLEAASRSLAEGGTLIPIGDEPAP